MEKEPILISWITQYVYCPYRLYLEAVEQYSADNIYTAEGVAQHKNVHKTKIEKRCDRIKITGMQIHSARYNLYGICDEMLCERSNYGCYIPLLHDRYKITPIEYKHGKSGRVHKEYEYQITAQTMCIEEMFETSIDRAKIYYIGSKELTDVVIDLDKRNAVIECVKNIEEIVEGIVVPKADYKKRCAKCSMVEICNPRTSMIKNYMRKVKGEYLEEN